MYVEIVGTNFREPAPIVPVFGPIPVPESSVRVLFGAVPALEVGWVSSTLIYAVTPQTAPGLVGVTVTNLDDAGVAIPGESVTKANAFTFERPGLRGAATGGEHAIHRVIAELVTLLRNQVFADFEYKAPHIDYRKPGQLTSQTVEAPNMTIEGPDFVLNMFYTQQGNQYIPTGEETFETRKRGESYDLVFNIDGGSNSRRELTSMRNALITFFRNNTKLRIPRDTSNPAAGVAEYELVMGDDGIRDTSVLSVSSISTFACSCLIRAFELETSGNFEGDGIVYHGNTASEIEFGGVQSAEETP